VTPLYRLIDPATGVRKSSGPRTHYEAADGQASLCGLVNVFHELDGEKIRVWHRTKRPVTCKSCTKCVEILARNQLTGLTGEQMEDILAHIDTFRNRYMGAKGGNGATVARAR